MQGDLISFPSTDGLTLDGVLFRAPRPIATVVHVHGSLGNFYQAPFVRPMAKLYTEKGINLLSFNLSSHDGIAEGYRTDNEFRYVGGSFATFDSCVADIAGAICFAKSLSLPIVLQGHSLGCDRVVHFLLETGEDHALILLSPCDSYRLQANWIAPETVEEQIERLRLEATDDEFDWLPAREYGVRQGDWTYSIPITRRALLSIAQGPPFRLFRLDRPIDYHLDSNGIVYIGGLDPLEVNHPSSMFEHLEHRIRDVQRLHVTDGDHNLEGSMSPTLERLTDWVIGHAIS